MSIGHHGCDMKYNNGLYPFLMPTLPHVLHKCCMFLCHDIHYMSSYTTAWGCYLHLDYFHHRSHLHSFLLLFGSYAKDCPNEWSDIDVAVIVPKTDKSKWWDTAVSLGRATRDISCYIEPILLENDEDSPIYREVMRTGVAV